MRWFRNRARVPTAAETSALMVRARVIREVKEEAVLDIEISGLLGVCTDPRHVVACADGGVRQEFDVTYCVRPRLRDHAEGLDHAYLG